MEDLNIDRIELNGVKSKESFINVYCNDELFKAEFNLS